MRSPSPWRVAAEELGIRVVAPYVVAGETCLALVRDFGSPRGTAVVARGSERLSAARHPQSDSNYGEFSWSWFPLGTRCSWTEEANGFDEVSSPAWGPSVLVAAQLGAGLAIGYADLHVWRTSTRRSARRRGSAALGQAGPVTSHDDPDGAGVA